MPQTSHKKATSCELFMQWDPGILLSSLLSSIPCAIHIILDPRFGFRFVFPEAVCKVRWVMIFTAAAASTLTYLLMAVQRFTVIVLNNQQLFEMKSLAIILPSIWICALLFVTPFWLHGEPYAMFWPDYCVMFSDYLDYVLKIITACVIYIPCAVIFTLYIAIYAVVLRSARRVQAQGGTAGARRKNIKMALVLFLCFFLFFAAYVPFTSYPFLRGFMSTTVERNYLFASTFTAVGVSAINPVVYPFLFTPVRQAYRQIFDRCCKRKNNEGNTTTVTTISSSN